MPLINDDINKLNSCVGRAPHGFWKDMVNEFFESNMDCALVEEEGFNPRHIRDGLTSAIVQHKCHMVACDVAVSMKKGVIRLYRRSAISKFECRG